ncbi:MAG: hypothetical protein EOO01_28145 [Chitinophagaceae bacterium]|nr:MAG: hypothetical protein EOO01_28145 [Chitinophagaceae bacterium]
MWRASRLSWKTSPATFLWLKGADQQPIDVTFQLPTGKNWTIATQLKPGQDKMVFTARDLQYLMDSPIKIGDLHWNEWTLANPDKKQFNFRIALEANTTSEDAAKFASGVEKVTRECQQVFDEFPAFDFNTYTFITGINPYVKGDGMEHRNSTVIHQPGRLNPSYVPGVFMHEFFHCWNVERIRPKTLEPFDFEKSNMSDELWFAEGFTQYYGTLISVRAGFSDVDNFAGAIAGLINTKENTPGAKRFSPVDVSRHAVYVDAGVSIDKNNYANMFTSYYTYGASVALALDMELRSRPGNLSLDDFMKATWKKFGVKDNKVN